MTPSPTPPATPEMIAEMTAKRREELASDLRGLFDDVFESVPGTDDAQDAITHLGNFTWMRRNEILAALSSPASAAGEAVFTIEQMRHAFSVGRHCGLYTKFTEEGGWAFYQADHIATPPSPASPGGADDADGGLKC